MCLGEQRHPIALVNFTSGKFEEKFVDVVQQYSKLCSEVKSVKAFAYLGNMVSTNFGCEATVTARRRLGYVARFYMRKFSVRIKGASPKSYGKAHNSVCK